jgi:hypothetical protein
VRLTGQSPLLMHNGQLANPFNKFAKALKEVTSKRKKTEEDQLAIMRIEWEGGLYFDPEVGPYVPSENLESLINDGARLQKRGQDVERAVFVLTRKVPLLYDGPRDVEGMWASEKFLDYRSTVNPSSGGRTMRARPIFYQWALELDVHYRPDVIDRADLIRFLTDAGQHKGLMDYRPRYGQFTVEVLSEKPAGSGRRAKAVAAAD